MIQSPQTLFQPMMRNKIVGSGSREHANEADAVDGQADAKSEGQSPKGADQKERGGNDAEKDADGVDASIRDALKARIGGEMIRAVAHRSLPAGQAFAGIIG
jgi:hypothetical protein